MRFIQPLEQFKVISICSKDYIVITNVSILDVQLAVLIMVILAICTSRGENFTNLNVLVKFLRSLTNILKSMVIDQTKNFSDFFFLYGLSLFMSILTLNYLALVPGNYCLTAQMLFTFGLALSVFTYVIFYFLFFKGNKFFNFFVPKNVPLVLKPFLVIIEIISFNSRVFSLAIRLFANMVSGHALLFILSNLFLTVAFKLLYLGFEFYFFIIIFSFFFMLFIFVMEIGIAFLQAFVFFILSFIYLGELVNEQH